MAYFINDSKENNRFNYEVYKTYKIESGDTLLSVGEKLNIDYIKLRHYHNRFCPLEDLIERDFKEHLQFVILSPEKLENQELQMTKRKKVLFDGNNYTIPFSPVNININYAVQFTTESFGKATKMGYEVSVKWIDIDTDGVCFLEIDRISDFFIDENKADNIIDELAEKTAKVIYPLTIAVNQIGKWIDVINFEEIEKRWINIKAEIIGDFDGKIASEYLEETQYILSDKRRFMKQLTNDWFLRSLFNGIHNDYGDKFKYNQNVKFPVIVNKRSVNFDVEHKIDEYLNDTNLIVIRHIGMLSENETISEFEVDYLKSGSYTAKYHLDPNHYSVERLKVECSVGDDQEEEKITVEIYNLNLNKEYVLGTRQPIYQGEEKRKESFFTGFINAFKI